MEYLNIFAKLPICELEPNDGQVPGLSRNPRFWTYDDVQRLVKSIRETPELLEGRGLIVYEYKGRNVILGGNMRFVALKELGYTEVPCAIYRENTPIEKLRRIVLKDNSAFGDWNYDDLEKDWSEFNFEDLGIKPLSESFDDEPLNLLPEEKKVEMSITCTPEEFEQIMTALERIDADRNVALLKIFGYEWA